MEDVGNVSHSDAQQVLKDIRKSNIHKFDMLSELIKCFVDVFMISEIKLDDSFPEGQFFVDRYHTYHTSARTYQQKSSNVIFQLLKVFLLIRKRKSG